jgi:hypothetical protein
MKPTVLYDESIEHYIQLGKLAVVHPLNHPDRDNVSNTKNVLTSKVIALHADGSFETENTLYKPCRI